MSEISFKSIGFERARLTALLKEHQLDGLFLSSPENVFYTTGYPCLPASGNPIIYALRNQLPFFAYCNADGKVTLMAWAQATMGIDYDVNDTRNWFTFDMAVGELTDFIRESMPPAGRLGIDSTFPYFMSRIIGEQSPNVVLVVADDLIQKLQLVKTDAEIERIRHCTAIIDKTVLELVDCLQAGMTRLELIREAKTRMLKNGADGVDHVTVAFGSANPELAFDEPLEQDQIVTLDLGAVFEGYVSDNRRLAYTGVLPVSLVDLHTKMCWVVEELGKALLPGKTFGDMNAYAYELYEKVGIEAMFLHVGHSIGLHVDEHWLLPDDPTVIEKNMVLNIELYALSDEGVMIGDEETYVVTDAAPQKLSELPVDILVKNI